MGFGLLVGSVGLATSCDAFAPEFINAISASGGPTIATVPNAPGHVAIQFVNNSEVDERLIAFLESVDGGNLILTDAQRRVIRPRVRLRVLVTFFNGVQSTIEFVDGSANLVDQNFNASALPDLNQNDLNHAIVLCPVSRVEILPGSTIEVFIPTSLNAYQLVSSAIGGGATVTTRFQLRSVLPPHFQVLSLDTVDEDGNTTLLRNIPVRKAPSPAGNPLCGSVVVIAMDGVLTVPFLDQVDDSPSYDQDDPASVAGIGGRYEFTVSIN